jgi:hypothetical protein
MSLLKKTLAIEKRLMSLLEQMMTKRSEKSIPNPTGDLITGLLMRERGLSSENHPNLRMEKRPGRKQCNRETSPMGFVTLNFWVEIIAQLSSLTREINSLLNCGQLTYLQKLRSLVSFGLSVVLGILSLTDLKS